MTHRGDDESAASWPGGRVPGRFRDRLEAIGAASEGRDDEQALELAWQLRSDLFAHQTPTPDPALLGWTVYYEVRSLHRLGRHAEGLARVVSPPPAPYDLPRAKTAWLQLAGAEMALCAGTPEQIVQLSQRAIELRLVDRDRHGAGLACETAVALLQASRRTDLIGELFEWLCALWTQAPAGSPGALYPALVASDLARSDGFAECLPDPQAFQRAQALHRAAATGDVREVRTLLQAGVDPNARNPRNPGVPTPLLTAAYHGHVDVLTILLDAGADLRAVNVQGRGPLHLAADQDQPEAVRRLVEAGARLDVCDFQWHTPLHIAAWQGHLGCVGELLAGGARLDAPDINGDTALGVAAAAEVPRVVRHLLRAGAPVDLSNDLGQTPLMRAAMEGRLVNVRLLLVAGADPRRTDLNEMSAAEWAAYEGWEALAELLVEGEQAMAEACWRDHHDRLHRRVQMQTPHMAS